MRHRVIRILRLGDAAFASAAEGGLPVPVSALSNPDPLAANLAARREPAPRSRPDVDAETQPRARRFRLPAASRPERRTPRDARGDDAPRRQRRHASGRVSRRHVRSRGAVGRGRPNSRRSDISTAAFLAPTLGTEVRRFLPLLPPLSSSTSAPSRRQSASSCRGKPTSSWRKPAPGRSSCSATTRMSGARPRRFSFSGHDARLQCLQECRRPDPPSDPALSAPRPFTAACTSWRARVSTR